MQILREQQLDYTIADAMAETFTGICHYQRPEPCRASTTLEIHHLLQSLLASIALSVQH